MAIEPDCDPDTDMCPTTRNLRELIEKRCAPKGAIDLRVPNVPDQPRTQLPPCD